MPATVWFGSGSQIKDSIKYKYDSCGNISEITQNGHVIARYTYDQLNRLIREDNKPLEKTVIYTYDSAGNITEKCEYAYTEYSVVQHKESSGDHYSYDYDGDKLVSYKGEACVYNKIGNPTTYRGKVCEWQYATRLTKYGDTTFEYDSLGRRTRKGSITFTYDSDGRLIRQSNGLEFIYDNTGVVGVKIGGATYYYRKDIQGNIIAVLKSDGTVEAEYFYDAWGKNEVKKSNGDNYGNYGIGALNPFRYRGYYYDKETELYYLQSRYYDPEVGRFISQDSIDYADPETINGLNLYAYCGNNPVMNVDPSGKSLFLFLCVLGGILLAGVMNGVGAVINVSEDENKWGVFLGGFVNGVISAAGIAAGIATGGVFGGIIAVSAGFLGGFAGDAISQSISYGNVDLTQATYAGVVNGLINLATFVGFKNLGIFNEPTWFKRFASVISPSAITSAISIFLMSLPIPFYKRKKNKINNREGIK